MSQIDALREQRKQIQAELDGIVAGAERSGRDFTPTESKRFDALVVEARGLDDRIDVLDKASRASAAAASTYSTYMGGSTSSTTTARFSVRERGGVYAPGSGHSLFRDIFAARTVGDPEAMERLNRNAAEQRAQGDPVGTSLNFAIPGYLTDDFVAASRYGRVVADLVHNEQLPEGRDSIILPRIETGTEVEPQNPTEGSSITLTPMTTSAVSSAVVTLAGGQKVNQQLLDQSPFAMDRVILQDLGADAALRLENQVIFGAGSGSRELTGLLVAAGTNSVTYTTATPTAAGVYSSIAGAIAKVQETRYMAPDAIVMSPRRWLWLAQSVDSAGRPLVTPTDGAFNSMATLTDTVAGGQVGRMFGLPVYVTSGIGFTYGVGTNEDRIIVMRRDDAELWTSTPRLEVLNQTYGANLQLLIRWYNYAAFVARQPKGVAIIGGTGLVEPTLP